MIVKQSRFPILTHWPGAEFTQPFDWVVSWVYFGEQWNGICPSSETSFSIYLYLDIFLNKKDWDHAVMNARTLACLLGQPTKEEERKKEGNESLTWQSIIICQNNCHTFAYQQPILFFYREFQQDQGRRCSWSLVDRRRNQLLFLSLTHWSTLSVRIRNIIGFYVIL